jgi:hypothetical protein
VTRTGCPAYVDASGIYLQFFMCFFLSSFFSGICRPKFGFHRTFVFSRLVNCATNGAAAGLNEGKKLSGEGPSPGSRPQALCVVAKNPAGLARFSYELFRRQQVVLGFTAPASSNLCSPSSPESLTKNFWNRGLGEFRECSNRAVGR